MTRETSRFDVPAQLAAMRRYARSLTRNETDAEDLVHDALVRAYEKRSTYQSGRGLRTWLLSILHNVFIDGRRSRSAESRREEQTRELADTVTAPGQEHHVRLGQIREAFLELPEEQRAALHLVAVEGLGYAEAAKTLGIAQGTLMSRLSRARAALRAVEDGTPIARGTHLKIVGGADEPSR